MNSELRITSSLPPSIKKNIKRTVAKKRVPTIRPAKCTVLTPKSPKRTSHAKPLNGSQSAEPLSSPTGKLKDTQWYQSETTFTYLEVIIY